ncbi:MAG: dTDP-4-dehydrorhamnose 3,5-epimerase [Simkaniaceae bacterium]|nr:dTDP-4-dehydrorhamnose 3,5-epimerase [Simkaniaceae bacterium]
METNDLACEGLKLIKPRVFADDRGFFLESYRKSRYFDAGIDCEFVQGNHSYSQQNTLRGMHYQSSPGQAKLIYVPHGTIFDVAVDMRPDSPTYMHWIGVELSGENHHQLFVPVGFAHGFYVKSPSAHVTYAVSSDYNPNTEKSFRFDDPQIGIQWPAERPILSERDANAPLFSEVI